jgi:hypothetical protein
MSNDNFRRELGQVFDDMTGTPSAALPDRVRSSVAVAPEWRGPFWIAGLAAAVVAAVVVGVLFVANPLNRPANTIGPGAGSSPSPAAASPSASPSGSPTPASNLPAFICSSSTGFVAATTTPPKPPVAFVDLVRIGTHAGYDRITIEFNNTDPGQIDVTTQGDVKFTQGASGQSIMLAGSAGILITMKGADEHTYYSGPTDFKTAYPVLVESRQVQDFEGTVQWGLGLSKSACYRAFFLTNPDRLVIDIQTP